MLASRALLTPGVGPIAAGPWLLLTGVAGGGLVGSLVDFGIPEERGRHYEERVKDILLYRARMKRLKCRPF